MDIKYPINTRMRSWSKSNSERLYAEYEKHLKAGVLETLGFPA
jgi:hypothetical protein